MASQLALSFLTTTVLVLEYTALLIAIQRAELVASRPLQHFSTIYSLMDAGSFLSNARSESPQVHQLSRPSFMAKNIVVPYNLFFDTISLKSSMERYGRSLHGWRSRTSPLLTTIHGLNCKFYAVLINAFLPFSSPELEVEFWTYGFYYNPKLSTSPPRIIPASWIECPLARGHCTLTVPQLWVTTTLDRVSCSPASNML
jgi:hypothetical protein